MKYNGSELSGDNMHDQDEIPTLRAIVSRWEGGLQAQLLELDLAVQGATQEQLLAEFAHAITVSYEAAMDHKETPFLNMGVPPKSLSAQWKDGQSNRQSSCIALRDDVAIALATYLHIQRSSARRVVFEEAQAA